MSYNYQDHYFHRARKDRYLSRAVYKLDEIQKKYKIFRPGDRVLDMGAAPGSWLQLVSGVVGSRGRVVGVDLKEIAHSFPPQVKVYQSDVFEPRFRDFLLREHAPFDVIVSDMAPATSGIKAADSARSELLFEQSLELIREQLKPRGHFLAKIFQGSQFHSLLQEVKRQFDWVKVVKPDASKKKSKEIYILAMRFRKPSPPSSPGDEKEDRGAQA